MSRSSKNTAFRIVASVALVNLLAVATASAATLNHRTAPPAASPASADDGSRTAARPVVFTGSTTVGAASRNCIRGHLSHGHC